MCLGIPGKIVEVYDNDDVRMGRVDFGGVFKHVCLAHTEHAKPGQYVIVHVGFALEVVDQEEAKQIFKFLDDMNELTELQTVEEGENQTPQPSHHRQAVIPKPNIYQPPDRHGVTT